MKETILEIICLVLINIICFFGPFLVIYLVR